MSSTSTAPTETQIMEAILAAEGGIALVEEAALVDVDDLRGKVGGQGSSRLCQHCYQAGDRKARACGKCLGIRYCVGVGQEGVVVAYSRMLQGKECQEKDWPKHKRECGRMGGLTLLGGFAADKRIRKLWDAASREPMVLMLLGALCRYKISDPKQQFLHISLRSERLRPDDDSSHRLRVDRIVAKPVSERNDAPRSQGGSLSARDMARAVERLRAASTEQCCEIQVTISEEDSIIPGKPWIVTILTTGDKRLETVVGAYATPAIKAVKIGLCNPGAPGSIAFPPGTTLGAAHGAMRCLMLDAVLKGHRME
ncbi:hypothetical protein HWV62_35947 [Athelia sp. TMB]|nr:hypothetical protein HWV62_35947 [Athelia sp. TMB]